MEQADPVTAEIIGSAIEVHRVLGPGLLESAYQQCLAHELALRGLEFRLQVPVPVLYKGVKLDCGFRIDLSSPKSWWNSRVSTSYCPCTRPNCSRT